ncbi:hypothetical protein BDF19DRAFT_423478 [Syncephalis fuscata]|nr:hypothetical protein BDF19DRAFT_423478 [Syncephalis fuscata]
MEIPVTAMNKPTHDGAMNDNWLLWIDWIFILSISFSIGYLWQLFKLWTRERNESTQASNDLHGHPSDQSALLASNRSDRSNEGNYGTIGWSPSSPISATSVSDSGTDAPISYTRTALFSYDNFIVYSAQFCLAFIISLLGVIQWRWWLSNMGSSTPVTPVISNWRSLELILDYSVWITILVGTGYQMWCIQQQASQNTLSRSAYNLNKRLHNPLAYIIFASSIYTGVHLVADLYYGFLIPPMHILTHDTLNNNNNETLSIFSKKNVIIQDIILLRLIVVVTALTTLLFLRRPIDDTDGAAVGEDGRLMTREAGASIWECMSFSWLSPLMKAGRQSGRIEEADLWELMTPDQASKATQAFASNRHSNLLISLLSTFKIDLLKQMGFACLWSLFMYSPPLFLNRLLDTISLRNKHRDTIPTHTVQTDYIDYAYFDALGLLLGTLFMSACLQQAAFYGQHVAVRTRAILSSLIFEKCLRRRVYQTTPSKKDDCRKRNKTATIHEDNNNGQETPVPHIVVIEEEEEKKKKKKDKAEKDDTPTVKDAGSITNLLNVDVQHISDAFSYTHLFVGSVIQIAVALTFLSFLLGWATAFGIASMLPVYWASRYVGRNFTQVMAQLLSASDNRLSIMNEVMQTIRIIKLFAWEPQFSDRIMKARETELKVLWQRMMMFIAFMSISMGGPVLIMSVTLGAYTTLLQQALTPSVAFTTVALFNSLRRAVEQFPEMLFWLLQCRVSSHRIDTFLSEEEVAVLPKPSSYTATVANSNSSASNMNIGFTHAFFSWNNTTIDCPSDTATVKDELLESFLVNEDNEREESRGFCLTDIHIQFPIDELTVIAGSTGSGKSSLLLALLGEMSLTRGQIHFPKRNSNACSVNMDHEVAYVAQQAWLQNVTIRENILFGMPYDEARYRQVVYACALERDFEILDAGDQTQVGEKGVTLSGGQKQRVALARAVYSRARHLLLDDCLSAVDAHTAKHIVDYCLTSPLMYGRTRILVTHHVEMCLADATLVVVLRAGRIMVQGTADAALASGWLPSCSESMTTSRQGTPRPSRPASIRERLNALGSPDDGESSGDNSISLTLDAIPKGHSRRHGRQKKKRTAEEEPEDDEDTNGGETAGTDNGDSSNISRYDGRLGEEEQRARGHVNMDVYRAYIKASGGYQYWVLVILLLVAMQVFVFAQPYWLRIWTNSVTSHKDHVVMAVAIRHYVIIVGTVRAGRNLHQQLTDRILHAKLRFFDATPVGRIMNRFSRDISAIDQELTIALGFFLIDLIEIGAIVLMISVVTPWFLVAGIGIAAVYFVVASRFVAASRDLKRLESVSKSPFLSLLNEALLGVTTIRAFGAQDRFSVDSLIRVDAMNRPTYHLGAANRWLSWRTYLAGSFVSFFTAIFILISLDHIDAGLAGFTLSTALMFSEITMWTVTFYGMLEMSMNGVERVHEYLQIDQEPPAIIESSRPAPEWPQKGLIQVENLVIQYSPLHTPVIRDLSFTVQPGERVGIVGRTGAGKSTLAVAFFRFVEATSGTIAIDGVNIANIGLHDLRSRLTIIPQDPILFNGTIRSNLDPFSIHSDDAIWNTLRRSHLIGQVDGQEFYPAGLESLDAPVSENGVNFSQGQRQLLAMARALLCSSKLIIMDEATASVDFETDTLIQQTVRNEFTDASLLCIAHRLRTIIDYDKVLVMDAGRLAEYDSPSVLIQQKDSIFRKLCEQSGEFDVLLAMATGV